MSRAGLFNAAHRVTASHLFGEAPGGYVGVSRDAYDELKAALKETDIWFPMERADYDDTEVIVLWKDGRRTIEDLDHDSDSSWWKERGAVAWAICPVPPNVLP